MAYLYLFLASLFVWIACYFLYLLVTISKASDSDISLNLRLKSYDLLRLGVITSITLSLFRDSFINTGWFLPTSLFSFSYMLMGFLVQVIHTGQTIKGWIYTNGLLDIIVLYTLGYFILKT